MNRTATSLLVFLAAAVSVPAQQPAPVPLFSAEVIRSFTPPDNPITDAKAKLGDMIFDEKRVSADNSVACNTCHSPRNDFTTHTEISRGVGAKLALETDYSDLGRFLVTQKREDIGSFRAPFLRHVLLTGPYMHDGNCETMWDVVEFFNQGGERNPFLDTDMKPLGLTSSEVEDVVNFLGALTSDRFTELRAAELDRQRATYQYRLAVRLETPKGSR